MKLKWKTADAPSGRYKSFDKRGWPSATYAGTDHTAVTISCDESYTAQGAKTGQGFSKPLELIVRIACYPLVRDPQKAGFEWKTLKARFNLLDEAKVVAERFLNTHPDFWPPELRTKDEA